jgi:hypothetical protein
VRERAESCGVGMESDGLRRGCTVVSTLCVRLVDRGGDGRIDPSVRAPCGELLTKLREADGTARRVRVLRCDGVHLVSNSARLIFPAAAAAAASTTLSRKTSIRC